MITRIAYLGRLIAEKPHVVPLSLGVTILIVRTILHIGNSLWLDETITAWIVKDGLRELIARSIEYQGQSPLYFLGPWSFSQLFGFNETSLRSPSLVYNLVTVAALYRLFVTIAGTVVAGYSAGGFAIIASASPELQSARPYALALCLFALALLFLVRWALTARWIMMVCFTISASGVLYAHYLFGLGFLLFPIILIFLGKQRIIGFTHFIIATILTSIYTLPATQQLRLLSSKASLYSFSEYPTVTSWLKGVSLDWSTISLVSVVCILWLANHKLRNLANSSFKRIVILALSLWAFPRLALVVASIITGIPVLVPRYSLYQIVGESLIQGVAICSIIPGALRRRLFLVACLISVLCSPRAIFFGQDWRSALNDIPHQPAEASVALVWTGLIETKEPAWILDPLKREYLVSPTALYPVSIQTFPLPLNPSLVTKGPIFSEPDRAIIDNATRLFIVASFKKDLLKIGATAQTIRIEWLHSSDSFQVRSLKNYPGLSVLELTREKRAQGDSNPI